MRKNTKFFSSDCTLFTKFRSVRQHPCFPKMFQWNTGEFWRRMWHLTPSTSPPPGRVYPNEKPEVPSFAATTVLHLDGKLSKQTWLLVENRLTNQHSPIQNPPINLLCGYEPRRVFDHRIILKDFFLNMFTLHSKINYRSTYQWNSSVKLAVCGSTGRAVILRDTTEALSKWYY